MLYAQLAGTGRDASEELTTRQRILIFEQDEYLASLLHLLLQREGYAISAITSIEDAQAHILSKDPPALVFVNNQWLLDDRPVILQMMENRGTWQHVPVIMLLNYFEVEVVEHALDNGVSDYLVQPFQPGELLDVIQKYIKVDD